MLHTYSPQTELIGLHLSCEGDRTASRVMKSTNPTVRWKPINSQIKSIKVPNGRTPTVNDETTTHTRHPHTPVTLPEPSPPMDLHFPSKTKLSRQILLFAKKSNSTFKFFITIHGQIPKTPSNQTTTNIGIKVSTWNGKSVIS